MFDTGASRQAGGCLLDGRGFAMSARYCVVGCAGRFVDWEPVRRPRAELIRFNPYRALHIMSNMQRYCTCILQSLAGRA